MFKEPMPKDLITTAKKKMMRKILHREYKNGPILNISKILTPMNIFPIPIQ
jgi:hypothetical protein